MSDPIRRFELSLLRPLWGIVTFLTVVAVFQSRWGWVASGVIADFYIGIVGAFLHPTLTASQLAQGPLAGTAAVREIRTMSNSVKNALVARGCQQVALLVGVFLVPSIMGAFGWHWYVAFPAALIVSTFVGFALTLGFRRGTPQGDRNCE